MTKKLFISYSHKDENHREDFNDHLSMLQRNGVVDCWHDRKIIAGDDWKNQIDDNLECADIIIFLVSPSFLASDYCYDVEVKRAMKRQVEGTAQIISIVIRPCDWGDSDFSKFQAVPKNAKPITTWEDKDTAWLDAIQSIKKHINEFSPKPVNTKLPEVIDSITPTTKTFEWLIDTEITLTHRKVNKVLLSDIYVVPDIEIESEVKSELVSIKSANLILKTSENFIISGEEQQGKTSLLKYYYSEFLKDKSLPLYLDSSKIKNSDIKKIMTMALADQYHGLSYDDFIKNSNRILLLDNIDEIGLNSKFRNIFLENINQLFSYTIITCHNSFSYVFGDIPALDEHKRMELLGFGNKKREDIIQKWILLGVEENIDDKELYSTCDDLKARLNIVIKKNIVPAKPIYVLMLLQMFEANAQLSLDLTSYGHCYQQLIYQSFDKAKIDKKDFDKYLNVLTELSWQIFVNDDEPNSHQLIDFFTNYNKRYLKIDPDIVLDKLISHAILNQHGVKTGFKYPYIYYFFVGKKIAESYSDLPEVKKEVTKLLKLLHREDFANILIFITHHTKDSWVLTEIKTVLNQLFSDQKVATLDKSKLAFMNDFMNKIPELILEQREIQKERDLHNNKLDELERYKEKPTESPDILANINKTFKGMEIAGQIIRNRHASLTLDALQDLAVCGASAGLKFLEYFIMISDSAKKEIVKVILNHLTESPNLTDKEIEKQAEHAYMHLTYGVINGVIRKIGSSIGSKEALEIYSLIEENENTPAFSLIKQAIELQFNKSLSIESVEVCAKKLHDNPVCIRILKEMIIQHTYMFPVGYKEKQQLSAILGISIQGQRVMDIKKIGKG
jgi:hypothetical protein